VGFTTDGPWRLAPSGDPPELARGFSSSPACEVHHAQLRAVAISQMDQHSFAQALERAILRSKGPPPPAALPAPEQHSASELKGNFPMRWRNLR
jgi:hypothetical protein